MLKKVEYSKHSNDNDNFLENGSNKGIFQKSLIFKVESSKEVILIA